VAGGTGGEQAVDLQLLRYGLRRQWRLIAAVAVGGASLGLAAAVLTPPLYSSTSVVLIAAPSSGQGVVLDPDTYAEIVRSNPVAERAIEAEGAALTAADLQATISASNPTDSVLEVKVAQRDPDDAAALSTAVAEAFIAFVEQITSPATEQSNASIEAQLSELRGQADQVDREIALLRERQSAVGAVPSDRDAQLLASLTAERADLAVRISTLQEQLDTALRSSPGSTVTARLLHGGDEPSRPSPVLRWVVGALAGGLAGFVVGAVVVVRRTRLDARVWSVQVLTRTVGSSVAASLRSRAQRTPEGWRDLLNTYEPPPADVWAVRLLLRSLDLHADADATADSPKHRRTMVPRLVVTSLAGDRKGQSLGLVVAAAAASLGVRTAVAIAGDPDDAVDVWAGLALLRHDSNLRDHLMLSSQPGGHDDCDIQIVFMSVDPSGPRFDDVPDADSHLLALAAGVATLEELARVSLAAFTAGHSITGALVADLHEWDEQALPWAQAQATQSPDRSAVVPLSPSTRKDPRSVGGRA
jgi:capsular polysaccharide biosynthesis protein